MPRKPGYSFFSVRFRAAVCANQFPSPVPGRSLLLVLLLALAAPSWAAYPSGFSEIQIASGLSSPTAMAFAPDGRLFVCEQGGRLRVIKNGILLTTPFLTVRVDSSGERGLLGVAFDPNFASNQFIYVYYTSPVSEIHNRVSRFTANGDVAAAGSEFVVMELDALSGATNHNGGAIHFGPDGKLYIAVGENANGANSQSFLNRHGKILRIDSNGNIPADNPFLAQTVRANRAIWAMGLRNPFTFSFHPGNGRMHINDVGQVTWEEVNEGVAGSNYGWPMFEGSDGGNPSFRDPLVAYHHNSGSPTGCAVTGGAFYPGGNYPAVFVNAYFYADFCSQWIYYMTSPGYNSQTPFGTSLGRSAVDLQVWNGELYYLTRSSGGGVYRIYYTPALAPEITQRPADQSVALNQTATFSVAATGTPPLTFEWLRNGAPIPGAPDSPSYTTPPAAAGDDGARFGVRVSNRFGAADGEEAVLLVRTNTPPTPAIVTPLRGSLYSWGQTIHFAGSASDAEDFNLPASSFAWKVEFHHGNQARGKVMEAAGVTSGTFTADFAETAADVFYRISLTVTDSGGAATTTIRDIVPETAEITLRTKPGGFGLTLDGIPVPHGHSFTGVVGQPRVIAAPSSQRKGKWDYNFQSWSDGGAQDHTIITPAGRESYDAQFQK